MNMGAFPSGQWGQTVNLLLNASVVRIHQLPPKSCGKDIAAAFFSLLYRIKSAKAMTDFQSAFYRDVQPF